MARGRQRRVRELQARGGSDDACDTDARNACNASAAKPHAATLGLRVQDGVALEAIGVGDGPSVSATITNVVFRYATKKAASADLFNMSQDPVGSFVAAEAGPETGWSMHVRFARLDAHRFTNGSRELVVLTPKSSDANIEASAIVRCERGAPGAPFDCENPGQPLAP